MSFLSSISGAINGVTGSINGIKKEFDEIKEKEKEIPLGQIAWGKYGDEDDNEIAKLMYENTVKNTFKNYLQGKEAEYIRGDGQQYHHDYLNKLSSVARLDQNSYVKFADWDLDGKMTEDDLVQYMEKNAKGDITMLYQDDNFNFKHDEGEFAVYNTYDYDNNKSTSWEDRNGNGIVDEGDLVEYLDNNTSGTVMQRWYDWNLNGAYDKGDWGYFAKFDDNGNEIEKWNEIVENSQS